MAFITKIDFSRQVKQYSGTTATLSGNTYILGALSANTLWVGTNPALNNVLVFDGNSFVPSAVTFSMSGGGSGATTYIQNGINTFTAGTSTNPSVNITGGTFNNLNITGGTLSSGGTDLYQIFTTTGGFTGWTGSSGVHSIRLNFTGNMASANYTLAGGKFNSATTNYSLVVGGLQNRATGLGGYSLIVGGFKNSATSQHSIVVGGDRNESSGLWGFVGGGITNRGAGNISFIGNGNKGVANLGYSSIINGQYNSAMTSFSFVANGKQGVADGGYFATVLNGYKNKSRQYYSTVINGNQNLSSGIFTLIGNGKNNTATTDYSTVVNGLRNVVNSKFGTILNGSGNTLNSVASGSTIVGGFKITGTSANTVYVPFLNIRNIYSATSIINLGLDVNGNVVTGTTGSGSTIILSADAFSNLFLTTGTTNTFKSPWGEKNIILSGETVLVQPNYQYLVYGNLTVYGNLIISGDVTTINGTLAISGTGTVNNFGTITQVDLATNYYVNSAITNSLSAAGFTSAFTATANVPLPITHNLGTKKFVYSITEGDDDVSVQVTRNTNNQVTLLSTFSITAGTINILKIT